MKTIRNPAVAACFIVLIAAICSIFSLYAAVDSTGMKFAEITNSAGSWVFCFVIIVLFVFACLTAFVCFCYVWFRQIVCSRLLRDRAHLMVRGLAVSMLALLGTVIWLTGGPTQSWFTPFLLVLIPLVILLEPIPNSVGPSRSPGGGTNLKHYWDRLLTILKHYWDRLLNERDRLFLLLFFVAVVVVYLLTAHDLWPSPFKLLDDRLERYKICYSVFVSLAVFFPTLLGLLSRKTNQVSGQPTATVAEMPDGSKEDG